MLTPRGSLSTSSSGFGSPRGRITSPRTLDANSGDVSPLPQAGAAGAAGATIDMLTFQKHRCEGLTQHGKLNQDVIQAMQSTLKNAVAAGQTHARVQTLFLSQHYGYSRSLPYPKQAHIVHDDLTLEPMTNCLTRINLAPRARELTEWLQEQGVHYICTSLNTTPKRTFGEPSLADFIFIVAVFIPQQQQQQEDGRVPWNVAFSSKVLDAPDVWNTRCVNAIRVGASYATICTLYYGMDFKVAFPEEPETEYTCSSARVHPTMKPCNKRFQLVGDKFKPLIVWVKQLSYSWTCVLETDYTGEDGGVPQWAYFTILLNPLKFPQ
jgi:hypothetical protein